MLKYQPSGDSALIIKAGEVISEEISRIIRRLLVRIEQKEIEGVTDFIPSYNELLVCYNPLITGFNELTTRLKAIESDIESVQLPELKVIVVPVLYGGDTGPDLEEVARHCNMSGKEVISIHCSPEYLVYMLGFTPGFCYLGGMDQRIAAPRKRNPALRILSGSVGIADNQTGIYPIESPGGWQIIGRTPLKLFDPARKPEFLIRAGDKIKFEPVTREEFEKIADEIKNEDKLKR
jgi:inhibitor of KinA